MQSKQRMKERVIDIFYGAGMSWQEDEEYFDDFCLEHLGSAINGIKAAFDLGDSYRLTAPHYLKAYDHVDTIVDLIRDCIQYDVS